MEKTTIHLPADLKRKAENEAREKGISLGELVRQLLNRMIQQQDKDPFFENTLVFKGNSPKDIASNHDKYLYGSDK